MTVDQHVLLDNTPDRDEPKELLEMRHRAPHYLTALTGNDKPNIQRSKIGGTNTWEIELGEHIVHGLVGMEAIQLSRPKTKRSDNVSLKPDIPKWSGITYHPKVTASPDRRVLRRIKGQRVTPDGYQFGEYVRNPYYPSGYPWRCVGKVEVWVLWGTQKFYYGAGAGALVGPNVMLTASHVFPWFVVSLGSALGWGWMMKFTPAYYDGTSILGSGVYSYCQTGQGYAAHDQGDDIIIMKLYTPLGNSLGWLGSRTYHDDWEDGHYWTKCGYPGAIASGQRPSRVMWFPIIDDDYDGAGLELEYRADSSDGDSGGPVFGWWDAGPYVVGVHSGGEEEIFTNNNVAAGGSILPSLVKWGHNHW